MNEVTPFTVSRTFQAPRAILFQAHSDTAHLSRWMGSAGETVLKAEIDFREGGEHHYGTRQADGSEVWGKQVFREIRIPGKIVLLQSFSDAGGGLVRHPLAPTWPLEMLSTTTFRDAGPGETELTVNWRPWNASEEECRTFDKAREGMKGGFAGSFGKLEAYLKASERLLLNSRLVDAPPERVWRALTDPNEVNAWWGPDGFKNTEVTQDVRVGGQWRFKMIGPDGAVYPNLSTYVELSKPKRLVYDCGDGERVHFRGVIALQDLGGKTLVSLSVEAPTREARDAFLAHNALEGGRQTLGKLAAFMK